MPGGNPEIEKLADPVKFVAVSVMTVETEAPRATVRAAVLNEVCTEPIVSCIAAV